MAVPRLLATAQSLTIARHQAVIEDLLDSSPSLVRLTFRPWRGPLADEHAIEARLEICADDADPGSVVISYWPHTGEPAPQQERIATAKLGAAWLESRVLAFVGRVLEVA